ncbi:glycosyltransferase involved in cell wall biosynthesis [Calidifontibacter indicus]|uniref:Glycosyltransferase involved in cell wall biosynthesis n=2 Tax=Calidifontibacter indicus TaxID=419650 RepID=A0A3D9V080_9MICO|nr:glycosyltransferase involved in cell wall biosynthesis [Calidifontibacter indicus]
MLQEFASESRTRLEFAHRWRRRLWSYAPRRVALTVDLILATATMLRHRPDIVYVNSTSAAIYSRAARLTKRPTNILHVHESGTNSDFFIRRAGLTLTSGDIRLVACSPSVRKELGVLLEVPESSIHLLLSVPDDREVRRSQPLPPGAADDVDVLTIGCCGTAELRKGVDLWVDAATRIQAALPERRLSFPWVGSVDSADRARWEAGSPIDFMGVRSDPYPVLRSFDVMVLPSRDDPFPLVVMEAMLLARPIVAFDVGGVRDQLGDAGVVVPASDVDALVGAVVSLVEDPTRRDELGRAAAERAEVLYTRSAFSTKLLQVLRPTPTATRDQANMAL